MAFWLMKSEPDTYAWADLVAEGRDHWDGVRNHQAANNMKAMRVGDRAFFYHSGKSREIVGVMKVVKEYYPDHTDPTGRFGMVDVAPVGPVKTPVSLAAIKADPRFHDFLLVRNSRLSVMPVNQEQWAILCAMGGIQP
jgi:predicted RNA-binding protein with PUA-like domain